MLDSHSSRETETIQIYLRDRTDWPIKEHKRTAAIHACDIPSLHAGGNSKSVHLLIYIARNMSVYHRYGTSVASLRWLIFC